MARVEVSATALRDLERLFDFAAAADSTRALAQLSSVRAAFAVLADHPLLGRVAEEGRRELVFLVLLAVFVLLLIWLLPKVFRGVRLVFGRLFGGAGTGT